MRDIGNIKQRRRLQRPRRRRTRLRLIANMHLRGLVVRIQNQGLQVLVALPVVVIVVDLVEMTQIRMALLRTSRTVLIPTVIPSTDDLD